MNKFLYLCIFLYINLLSNGWTYKLEVLDQPVPNRIHIFTVNPLQCDIRLAHAREQRETLSSITQRFKAIAGINAGFFRRGGLRNGNSIGLLKIKEEIFSDPGLERGTLVWNTGADAQICQCKTQWILTIADEKILIDKVNQPCVEGEVVFFNKYYGKYIDAPNNNLNLVIVNNKITALDNKIPHSGYVISLAQERISNMHELCCEASVALQFMVCINGTWQKFFSENTTYCVNGAGTLIKNNRPCTEQELITEISTGRKIIGLADEISANFKDLQQALWLVCNRHPRTAVGLTENNEWVCVVVEGRHKGADGMTLTELAEYLHKRRCINALNLGGGGDSTMVIENIIKNIPSGSSTNTPVKIEERPISDAILIFEKK